MTNNIIIIGSFKIPIGGNFGGVYQVSTTLRDKLISLGFKIIEIDTTLKNINVTKLSKRFFSVFFRQFYFIYSIFTSFKAKYIFIFLSGGNSYVDKLLVLLFSKLFNINIVIFPRSGYLVSDFKNKIYSFLILLYFSTSDKIICQSLFWKNFFISKGVDKSKLLVIENWVSNYVIEKSEILNFKTDFIEKIVFKMVFLSRIEEDKGIKDVLDLALQLKESNTFEFEIDVYGSGSYEDQFIIDINDLALKDCVKYKGWLSKDVMLSTLNKYNLGLFFSKTEGYPNALLDFIFAKIPILASKIPMVEAVGKDNMVYWDKNANESLIDKVLFCHNNYSILIKNSKKLYLEKYEANNIDFVVSKLLNNI
ncbi:glycosyltransferase [Cyclobacterium amurskyense]|uniref:glycosyltransferase n=1 Tax=Cyclobacterium amurskyense TaxID=320787 RepID=UPI0030D9E712